MCRGEAAEVTVAEELIAFASKGDMLAKSKEFWNPGKTQFWVDSGVPLVIDRREGYFIYDVEGKRLIDTHLNGGTYNLGHRNPEVVAAVTAACSTSTSATITSPRSPGRRFPRCW